MLIGGKRLNYLEMSLGTGCFIEIGVLSLFVAALFIVRLQKSYSPSTPNIFIFRHSVVRPIPSSRATRLRFQ